MGYRWTVDPAHRLVRVTGSGPADREQTAAAIRAVAGDPAYRSDFNILFDVRDLDYIPSLEDAWHFQHVFRSLHESYRGTIVMVVTGTVRYGVGRMVGTLLGLVGVRMETFQEMADAEELVMGAASTAA